MNPDHSLARCRKSICCFFTRQLFALPLLLLSFAANAEELNIGMAVAAHPSASEAGLSMLKKGGNAFDAAAAITLALGVVEPASSGFGGGGFFLLYIDERKTLCHAGCP